MSASVIIKLGGAEDTGDDNGNKEAGGGIVWVTTGIGCRCPASKKHAGLHAKCTDIY